MINKSDKFWINRYKRFSHTGWSNQIIYAYDQIERLAIISELLGKIEVDPLFAIDFGCGTGDFCKLLLSYGYDVWGYDPYVKPIISNKKFKYISQWDKIKNLEIKTGINLSVTVLDHVIVINELRDVLNCFRRMISSKGYLLLLEYALDNVRQVTNTNDYQAFRLFSEWESILTSTGWGISSLTQIPHPVLSPSVGFKEYISSFPIQLLNSIPYNRILLISLSQLLSKHAKKKFTIYGTSEIETSPLKLIICQPR